MKEISTYRFTMSIESLFKPVTDLFTRSKGPSIETVSPVNLITGIAIAILGLTLAITGSPFFGVSLILVGIAVSLIVPDLSGLPKTISEILK